MAYNFLVDRCFTTVNVIIDQIMFEFRYKEFKSFEALAERFLAFSLFTSRVGIHGMDIHLLRTIVSLHLYSPLIYAFSLEEPSFARMLQQKQQDTVSQL